MAKHKVIATFDSSSRYIRTAVMVGPYCPYIYINFQTLKKKGEDGTEFVDKKNFTAKQARLAAKTLIKAAEFMEENYPDAGTWGTYKNRNKTPDIDYKPEPVKDYNPKRTPSYGSSMDR